MLKRISKKEKFFIMIIMLGVSILTQLKTLFEIKSLLLDKINCINYFIFIKKNNLLIIKNNNKIVYILKILNFK